MALAIHFDNGHLDLLADHLAPAGIRGFAARLRTPHHADLRSRHKTAQRADRNDQAAFVVTNHLGIMYVTRLQQLFHIQPILLFTSADVGKNQIAVLVLWVDHKDWYLFADGKVRHHFSRNLIFFLTCDDPL